MIENNIQNDRKEILKLITIGVCLLELLIAICTFFYQQDTQSRTEIPISEEMARVYIDHPEKLKDNERLAVNRHSSNQKAYMLITNDIVRRAFSLVPEYLRTAHDDTVRNLMDYGIPLGRRFRALKFWFVLRYFGWNGLADRLREHIRIAAAFADWVDEDDSFERLAPVYFGTVCFRAHPKGINDEEALNTLNETLFHSLNRSRQVFLSHTALGSRYTIRMVIGHIKTREAHARQVWDLARQELRRLNP